MSHSPTKQKNTLRIRMNAYFFVWDTSSHSVPHCPAKQSERRRKDEYRQQGTGNSQQVKRHVDSCDSDIPDMPLSDMVLFIGLKYIYVALKSQMTTPEEASLAKKKLVVAYQAAEYDRELYQQETRKRNRIASELVELEK